MRAVALAASIAVILAVVMAGAALAEQATQVPPATVTAAQAAPAPVAVAQAPKAAPTSGASTPERVDALEKQNLVLSEDVGKARLKARELEDLTKQQAEAIKKLNQQAADEKAKAQAEKEKQHKRNQYLWIAVGVLALGVIASN